MTHLLVLDASIVGAITNPKQANSSVRDCQIWFRKELARQSIFVLPEITDYETIVTTNVGHLAQFIAASHWQDLPIDRD